MAHRDDKHLIQSSRALAEGGSVWTLILVALLLSWFAALYYFHEWGLIGVPSYALTFMDWHGVVAASDCAKLGFNVYFDNPCDALNRVHNYGSLWLKVSSLGLTRENQWEVGLLISASFLVSAALMLRPRNVGEFLLSLAATTAPAVMFGVEQANVDLLIFMVVLLVTFLYMRRDRLFHVLAAAICILLTFLKLYPVAAIAPIFWTLHSRRSVVVVASLGAIAPASWLLLNYKPLLVLYSIVEKPGLGSNVAMGSSLLFIAMREAIPSLTWLSGTWASLASFCVLSVASFFCARRFRNCLPDGAVTALDRMWFIVGGAIMVFAFFATTNYDYRYVFLLFLIPLLIRFSRKELATSDRRIGNITLGLILSVLWATGLMTFASSVLPEHRLVFLAVKYLLSWALMFMMMTICAIFVLRRWDELAKRSAGDRASVPSITTA